MNYSEYDFLKLLKKGIKYMFIALPFMAVVCIGLTIAKIDYWLNLFITVLTGGICVFATIIISNKLAERKKQRQKDQPKKYDPFKD